MVNLYIIFSYLIKFNYNLYRISLVITILTYLQYEDDISELSSVSSEKIQTITNQRPGREACQISFFLRSLSVLLVPQCWQKTNIEHDFLEPSQNKGAILGGVSSGFMSSAANVLI